MDNYYKMDKQAILKLEMENNRLKNKVECLEIQLKHYGELAQLRETLRRILGIEVSR